MLAASMMMIDSKDDDYKRWWRDDYEDGGNTCPTYFTRKWKALCKNKEGSVMSCQAI